MKLKLYITLFALAIMSASTSAQTKKDDVWKKAVTVKSFRTAMKEKNYSKAKGEVDNAINKYEEAKKDAEMYSLKSEALNELINGESRKIYLKQNPDTTKFFSYIYEMYETGLACEQYEDAFIDYKAHLGKKQAVKYRYNVGSKMASCRKNLLMAGKYYYKKQDYKKSFDYLNMYIVTKDDGTMFDKSNKRIIPIENDLADVSSLAVLSAYASSNHEGVLRHLNPGLEDESVKERLLEIGCKAASALNDTVSMVINLEQGYDLYPENDYFFVNLVKHYNATKQYELAYDRAKKMTSIKPNVRDFWFIRGKEEMLCNLQGIALKSFGKCIEIKADDAESYSSIGNIYLYFAHLKYSTFDLPVSDPQYAEMKQEINDDYQKACEYFELAKKFDENNTSLWLEGLKETYFKLNKGKELKKLDKYM